MTATSATPKTRAPLHRFLLSFEDFSRGARRRAIHFRRQFDGLRWTLASSRAPNNATFTLPTPKAEIDSSCVGRYYLIGAGESRTKAWRRRVTKELGEIGVNGRFIRGVYIPSVAFRRARSSTSRAGSTDCRRVRKTERDMRHDARSPAVQLRQHPAVPVAGRIRAHRIREGAFCAG
jgi:hypothetical protein